MTFWVKPSPVTLSPAGAREILIRVTTDGRDSAEPANLAALKKNPG
jgi:hypothetical protein